MQIISSSALSLNYTNFDFLKKIPKSFILFLPKTDMEKREFIQFLAKKMADPQKIDFLSKNANDVSVSQGYPKNSQNFIPTHDIFLDVLEFAQNTDVIYVEGYVFDDKKNPESKTEHAWIKLKNKKEYFDPYKINGHHYISVIEMEPNKVKEIKNRNHIEKGGVLSTIILEYSLSVKNPRKS